MSFRVEADKWPSFPKDRRKRRTAGSTLTLYFFPVGETQTKSAKGNTGVQPAQPVFCISLDADEVRLASGLKARPHKAQGFSPEFLRGFAALAAGKDAAGAEGEQC
jgi:hypothetical protein